MRSPRFKFKQTAFALICVLMSGNAFVSIPAQAAHPLQGELESMFGAMSLYGYVTGRDLSTWGNLLTMALVGILIASLANLFLKSDTLMWIVTYAGILLFVGLTAYDTQKIKRLIQTEGYEVNDSTQKIALMGALTLYLDFINLFLYLLRLMGDRK